MTQGRLLAVLLSRQVLCNITYVVDEARWGVIGLRKALPPLAPGPTRDTLPQGDPVRHGKGTKS